MLRLENEQFIVNEVDVDGSAMKTVDFMANVRRIRNHLSGQQRTMKEAIRCRFRRCAPAALPSPATTVPHDWCNISTKPRTMRHNHQNGIATDLFAEDVTRGDRIDVENDKQPDLWLSLCARVGTYLALKYYVPRRPSIFRPTKVFLKGTSSTSVPGTTTSTCMRPYLGGTAGA